MNNLRNPILATIIYYDVFDYPLTLIEVFKYLINPARIVIVKGGIGEIDINMLADELDRLVKSKLVEEKNGFYFLSGRTGLYDLRIKRQKIAERKWKKFLKASRWLQLAPYLRGIMASGSMAINNTEEKSDFDVLIIVRSGRLYTCRLFLWLISSAAGVRRKKWEKVAPDKLCFNHYLAGNALYVSHESLFNAQSYVNLKPVFASPDLVDRFYSSNLWLNNYVYNFSVQKHFVRRSIRLNKAFLFFAKLIESVLNLYFGEIVERFFRRFQQNKIKKDPITYESGGRVVFTESELEFHPYSFEKTVLAKYKIGLNKLGIVSCIEEKDSGLKP